MSALSKILRRGEKAKRLFDHEIFQTAKQDVRISLMEEWRLSKAKDSETRERIYMAVRLLDELDARLVSYISDAEYERLKSETKG